MARLPYWLPALALAFGAARDARADMYYAEPPPPKPPDDEFWREVVAPHGDEIQMILDKARLAWNYTSTCVYSDCDATGESRTKLLEDGYGMLRYARKLDPTQPDVLLLLGQFAEESGRPSAAIEALQTYLGTLDPDATVPPEASLRLGRAYLRLGRTEDAIRQFRAAITSGMSYGPQAAGAAYLGDTLMNAGRMSDALDMLSPNLQFWQNQYYAIEPMQAVMTLAVAYDRDEQINAAFGVLDALQAMMTSGYGQYVQQGLSNMLFVPAYEEHYYLALFYESQGYLSEARTEWLHYAAVEDAPFRARALDHSEAIDQLLGEKLVAAQKAAKEAEKAAAKAKKAAAKPPKKQKKPKKPNP
jgi:tetratricopeptide (TPR) repeat protein